MKHIKNKPPEFCEKWREAAALTGFEFKCGKPAKYERLFDDPKAKPMMVCGVHANQARRRGYTVKAIGE